jgi:hypothetical protein
MPLVKLQMRPGLNREVTSYANEGGWFDADKVRFRFGYPEKIGGWTRRSSGSFLGKARALHPFVALDGTQFIGVATSQKYYIDQGGGFNDITPLRLTTAVGGATFAAVTNTLSAGISATDATIPLTSAASFPSSGRVLIDSEQITYASISGSSLIGCVRGVGGTTAATHSTSAVVACGNIKVTAASHGANVNDFVTFAGAASLGGNIVAGVLNQEYQIATVESGNVFTIQARTAATSLASITVDGVLVPTFVFPTTSDSGSGGASALAEFQVNVGLDTTVTGTGWGAGPYGRGSWGSGYSLLAIGQILRIWSHDNFGEDLLINVRDGGIYYWDRSLGITSRAVPLGNLSGSDGTAPVVARQVMVSNRDRHVIALGCDGEANPGVQDPLLIRFSDQENPAVWKSLPTNSAGELRISTGSGIIAAIETRQQILVFTESAVHALQYLGPPYTFGLSQLADNTTIAAPLAAIAVGDNVFWMGVNDFYMYTGQVIEIPCPVRSYVFNDFNTAQNEKVFAASNNSFSEVWWFYPSAASEEIDRYVVFNYQDNLWFFGTLSRTAWTDRGIYGNPVAAGIDGRLYLHEFGTDDGTTVPDSAINSYITSSDVSIGEGDRFVLVRRIIPDVTFVASTTGSPAVTMTVSVRDFPGQTYQQAGAAGVARSATAPVEQFTQKVDLRLRGRAMSLKVQSTGLGVQWRLGAPRVDVRTDGQR